MASDETNNHRSQVAVIAYCANNLGDDLFITILLKRYPKTEFHFFAQDQEQVAVVTQFENAKTLTFPNFKQFKSNYDLLLVLGGSMFQEQKGWTKLWLSYVRRFIHSWLNGIPIAVVGSSFGPAPTRRFRLAFAVLFSLCASISFRDEQSVTAFPRQANVSYYPDIAFGYALPRSHRVTQPVVALSIMKLGNSALEKAHMRQGYANLIEHLTQDRTVRIFSFQESALVSDGDEIRTILSLLTERAQSRVETVIYSPRQLISFLTLWAECDVAVSSRFHAMVLGLLSGQRLCVLSYHEKIDNTLDSLGLRVPTFSAAKLMQSVPEIVRLLDSEAFTPAEIDLPGLRSEAEGHFSYLDELLLKAPIQ